MWFCGRGLGSHFELFGSPSYASITRYLCRKVLHAGLVEQATAIAALLERVFLIREADEALGFNFALKMHLTSGAFSDNWSLASCADHIFLNGFLVD